MFRMIVIAAANLCALTCGSSHAETNATVMTEIHANSAINTDVEFANGPCRKKGCFAPETQAEQSAKFSEAILHLYQI